MPAPATAAPLPWQSRLVHYLKTDEADLWEWYSSQKVLKEYGDGVRLDILKTAYRLDRQTHAPLYARADAVLAKLGLAIPLTLYQSQVDSQVNASICPLPGEGHLIFCGPILSTLAPEEVDWTIGHELSHFILFDGWAQDYLIASQILSAMAAHPQAEPSQLASGRLFQLYAEIFADRNALAIADPLVAVAALVKLQTGLKEVSAVDYLRQADEILESGETKTEGLTHPEAYIRARAIRLWVDGKGEADAEIDRMLAGKPGLDDLDLLEQKRLSELTRRVIQQHLATPWLRSDPVLAHAKLFFSDFAPATAPVETPGDLAKADPSIRNFFSYLLLDFASADPQIGEPALAASILSSRRLGLEADFLGVVTRELKLKKKAVEKLAAEADQIVQKVQA